MVKKVFKRIGIGLLILLGAFLLALLIMFIVHRTMLHSEEKMLSDKGYLNRVSVGEYSLNVCSYGSDEPKHTLVGISGMGVNNYSAAMRQVTDRFADENKIVFVDRAGYGLSDDTKVNQTLERVVEDYRNALKNAGFEAPYVLLPHSLGGVYTTYWLSKYPEEIEGVVFLDCSELTDDPEPFDNKDPGFSDYAEAAACKIGLQRLFLKYFDAEAFYETGDELKDINKALLMNKSFTWAMLSESKLVNENYREAYKNMVKTDVPKIYICSGEAIFSKDDFSEMFSIMSAMSEKTGRKTPAMPDDETIDIMLEQYEEFRNNSVFPYVEALGNCEIRYINGTHMHYVHKPDETAAVVAELLDKL